MPYSNWWARLTERMSPPVFFGSAFLVVGFSVFGGAFTETASSWFSQLQQGVTETFGWYYALATTLFLIFSVWLMTSRFGSIRLGPPDARPNFGYPAWFAMLFSAGMGIGIVFWGVAEPLHHYLNPLFGETASPEAARKAMQYTFLHWGLHAWAIYIVMSVAIAYFHFRRGLPLAPRSTLYPLIGERIHGPLGHGVDILSTVGTLLGVATSLGLGAMQINAGLAESFGVAENTPIRILVIALITFVATLSVVSGIQAGIRRLSLFNLGLAGLLMLFVLVMGPTVYLAEVLVGSTGLYLQHLPVMSLFVEFGRESEWQSTWTLFYWGWWIAWSPFVGVFVARISRGRTIREFVFYVLFIPTLGTFVWLAVFGGAAMHVELFEGGGLATQVKENVSVSLHALLSHLPGTAITQLWATLVIILFFITSSDSGSLVDDMVTSGGHPNPPRIQRVFWALAEGAVAATLLIVGGLRAIQDLSISLGFLMSILLLLACWSLLRSFREEYPPMGRKQLKGNRH